jgi:hypothetical protein
MTMTTLDVLMLLGIVGFLVGIWRRTRLNAKLAEQNRIDQEADEQAELGRAEPYAGDDRLTALYEIAQGSFTPDDAAAWLRKPHPMLNGSSPQEVGRTDVGFQRVKDLLINLQYGGAL